MDALKELKDLVLGSDVQITEEQWRMAQEAVDSVDPDSLSERSRLVADHEAGHLVMDILAGRVPQTVWSTKFPPYVDTILGFQSAGAVSRGPMKLPMFTKITPATECEGIYAKFTDERCLQELLSFLGGSVAQSVTNDGSPHNFLSTYGRVDEEHVHLLLNILLRRHHPIDYGRRLSEDGRKSVRQWMIGQISSHLDDFLTYAADDRCGDLIEKISDLLMKHLMLSGDQLRKELWQCVDKIRPDETVKDTFGEIWHAYEQFHGRLLTALKTPGVFAMSQV